LYQEVNRRRADRKNGALSEELRKRGQAIAGARILVAEDNRINQQVVKEFLRLSGIHVDLANDGRKALTLLEENTYDAVLMDIHMPEMGGLEATATLRKHEKYTNLPVIALTAGVTQDEREACLSSGMNAFVSKPIIPGELIDVLTLHIKPLQ
jgi:CheY-like chemotaxis protein